jgi:hypothetical protein
MSVLFYIPSVLWHALATKTGFDIANLVKTLHSMEQLNPDIRDRTLRYIAKHIDRALEIQREMGTGFFSQFVRISRRYCPVFLIGRAQGNYLTFVYLFVKLLYITNVIGQLFLLNVNIFCFLRSSFLNFDFLDVDFYGFKLSWLWFRSIK